MISQIGSQSFQSAKTNPGHPMVIVALALTPFLAYGIAKTGLPGALMVGILSPGVWMLFKLFERPRLGLYAVLLWAFFGLGLKRYVMAVFDGGKLGLGIDILLVITWIAVVFKDFDRTDWSPLKNSLTAVVVVWFAYTVLELFNPEAQSTVAWFYAMRGVALYIVLTIPLTFLLMRRRRDVTRFLWLWLGLSIVGVLWGAKQLFIGLDGAEAEWLSDPNHLSTHVLHGRLRVFSFYTDAGQFGAAMGHASISSLILALGPWAWKKRAGLLAISLACFWGLMISGTRGALVVPVVGALVYLVINKNWKLLLVGIILLSAAYGFFRFTWIGQSNYHIGRMRHAIRLGTDVPSLQARLRNQRILSDYLSSRPFGGGVGSAGYWGRRFSPHTLLAKTPTDSWYVRIWAEQGIVGLFLHLVMLVVFFSIGARQLNSIHDPGLRQQVMALYAGVWGIVMASYGNQILGQMPTGIVSYMSMALVVTSPTLLPEDPVNSLNSHTKSNGSSL